MRKDQPLVMWTIYDSPKDFPGQFVARRFDIFAGNAVATAEVRTAPTIEMLRRDFRKMGLFQQPRHAGDDPVIVEVWF